MSPGAAINLQARIGGAPQLSHESSLGSFVKGRMNAVAARGEGHFSRGTAAMSTAFGKTHNLRSLLSGLEIPRESDDPLTDNLGVMASFFRNGATRAATLDLEQATDTDGNTLFVDIHGATEAKKSELLVGNYMNQIAQVFQYLKDTPYDEERSLLDVTTVAVASEFSRTMRQLGNPIDATGTDHNPLNNTILIGGKGIKGGLVLGESDRRTAGETVSSAHEKMDPYQVKIMGKPFDFAAGRPRPDLPEEYRASDYITTASVTNTLFQSFGIGSTHHSIAERNGSTAPVLTQLLA